MVELSILYMNEFIDTHMNRCCITVIFLVLQVCPVEAQDTTVIEDAFEFEASYVGDNAFCIKGGIKSGYRYLGMANMRIGFDFEKAGLWKGGEFYINAANTHGACPSADMFGDMQVASNIEAGNHTYIQELWIKQAWDHFELTAGLQDLNIEFALSEFSSVNLNSSFGVLPTLSNNLTAPIFPLTALAITTRWEISPTMSWRIALYDGSPTDFKDNPYNLKWRFGAGDGLLAITEFQQSMKWKGFPGIYKIGLFSHNHLIEKWLRIQFADTLDHHIYGFYGIADQEIRRRNKKSMGLFAQLGYCPYNHALTDFYMGFGVKCSGLLGKDGTDVLELSIAHEHFASDLRSETAVELTYQCPLTGNLFIQPDIQYIIHPAGTGETMDNCLALFLRFGISL
jgi:porin